ncbi:phage shock protein PspD [Mangrovibacter yixingensis]|uniref:phage shock protein PspD n=1 Tax=Mangrovibacter yixingensis TaxID=1529639 RepID=UPI001CFA63A6|nr:phage shock protein PspD [Mangrovibacter yixingensis]
MKNEHLVPGHRRLAPLLMLAATLALRVMPAGVASLVIRRVAYKPVRLILGVILEPLLRTGVRKYTQRWHNRSDL